MTEEEWMKSEDSRGMEEFVRATSSPRKERLFYCACCRHYWENIKDDSACRNAVLVAEAFADGKVSADELTKAYQEADEAAFPYGYEPFNMAVEAARPNARLSGWDCYDEYDDDALKWYCEPLRCIFGPLPFRSVSLDPALLTQTVKKLAEAIYETKDFDRLPILADALEETGCTNADLLVHCRQPGVHVRGCWALDLLLGKE